MKSDAGAAQGTARLFYPELPDPLTSADRHRVFSPSYDERKWAPTVARTPSSQVALLVQLKIFQTIGRFRRVEDIPATVIEHVARRLGIEYGPNLAHPDRTLYQHRPAVLKYLGVTPWGATARELAQSTMIKTAEAYAPLLGRGLPGRSGPQYMSSDVRGNHVRGLAIAST